jgi:hypothetical protein
MIFFGLVGRESEQWERRKQQTDALGLEYIWGEGIFQIMGEEELTAKEVKPRGRYLSTNVTEGWSRASIDIKRLVRNTAVPTSHRVP